MRRIHKGVKCEVNIPLIELMNKPGKRCHYPVIVGSGGSYHFSCSHPAVDIVGGELKRCPALPPGPGEVANEP